MFKKILIANRGEIALRIIRACKELEVETVAIYSEADVNSLHVRFADEAVCIGPAPSSESYLHISRIISAAEATNCDAIHPGYGFLAENADFAEVCESCEIKFIGPSPQSIRKMGDKALARQMAMQAGVPVIPGSEGVLENLNEAKEIATSIGFPIRLKASAGGGGRGIRIVYRPEDLESEWQIARAEAQAAFGDSRLYIERSIEKPRHVEIQIIGDSYGQIIHLGERDCSIQRRHQKLIEESPSPAVDETLRQKMGEAAIKTARSADYYSTGTIEFLLDLDRQFYFMEMNTRIQVEHPVTEMVTDCDLVKEQIRVATGETLKWRQDEVRMSGHAIECRINSEDPKRNFMPTAGLITVFHVPGGPGIRVDTHAYAQYKMPHHYDSLLAKLIAYGRDREEAIARMKRALEEFVVEGVPTTIPFHIAVMDDDFFRKGDVNTAYIENHNLS